MSRMDKYSKLPEKTRKSIATITDFECPEHCTDCPFFTYTYLSDENRNALCMINVARHEFPEWWSW